MAPNPRDGRAAGSPLLAVLAGAAVYFASVFAVGFAFGVVRTLAAAPALGEHLAVLIELPVMLAVSWLACRWITRRFSLPAALAPRLAMGALAFALLMTAELGLSVLALGRSLGDHLAAYQSAPAVWGLLAQLAFATFPVVQGALQRS